MTEKLTIERILQNKSRFMSNIKKFNAFSYCSSGERGFEPNCYRILNYINKIGSEKRKNSFVALIIVKTVFNDMFLVIVLSQLSFHLLVSITVRLISSIDKKRKYFSTNLFVRNK